MKLPFILGLILFPATLCFGETVYFIVGGSFCGSSGETERTNAFVLPISGASNIAQARLRAATCGGFAIAPPDFRPSFRLMLGADGTNRNFALPAASAWSWHASEFVGWAGVLLDGRYHGPFDLEHDVVKGNLGDGDVITFSDVYTVVSELNPPLRLFYSSDPSNGTILFWTHHDPALTYAAEWTTSLTSSSWHPLIELPPATPNSVPVFPLAASGMAFAINPDPNYSYFFRLRVFPTPH